jgi:hypothetical protein
MSQKKIKNKFRKEGKHGLLLGKTHKKFLRAFSWRAQKSIFEGRKTALQRATQRPILTA